MASRGLCPLEHPALQVHTASPSPEQPSALRRGAGAQDPQGRSPGAQLCSGMVTDSVISPRVSRCYRKAFVPFCKHLCTKTPGGEESPCETPPRGERRPPQSPWGKGEGAKIGGPWVREKPPCKATQGERSPHTGPLGVEERRLHAGPGGCLLKEPWRGQSRFRGQGVPRVSPTSLQLNRGRLHYFQHHLVPGMTSVCCRRASPGWTGPVLRTTTSPDTPRGEADRAQLSDPETTTKHKTRYSSL